MSSNILELIHVTKKYHSNNVEQVVLEDVSYQFKMGLVTSILGDSGCGKTTLLNLLGGLDSDFNGEILYNGSSIENFDQYRRENVSFIFQDINLINHHNLIQNIKLGLTNDVENKELKAQELLKKVGLEHHAEKKPNQLSGGEKQRVAIARALARDADVLLCDEPTGNLDIKTKKEIMNLIVEIFKEKTIIFITHDENLAKEYSDVILTIDSCKVNEQKIAGEEALLKIKAKNKHSSKDKNFNNKFVINLLSNKRSIFNATYLFVVVSAILLFGIGMINGAEKEFDKHLYNNYKTDSIYVETNGMTLNGLKQNIEDFNNEFDTEIKGLSTGLFLTSRFVSSDMEHDVYLNSINDDIRENFEVDIVYGRYPENTNEALYSKGAAIKTILKHHNYTSMKESELKELVEKVTSYSNQELFNELLLIELDYSSTSPYTDEIVYDTQFEIVGIIDDYDYFPESNFLNQLMAHDYERFKKIINVNRDLIVEYDSVERRISVNNNVYVYEDELINYINRMYFGNNGYKFMSLNLFIEEDDLDVRKEVFGNFLLFKPIFKGSDHVTVRRDTYYADMQGYKVAIVGGCVILFFFSALSIINGIRTILSKHKSNIGIYKSLGYSSSNIKAIFFKEGVIISLAVTLITLIIWGLLNVVLNEKFLEALDPSDVLEISQLINLDFAILSGIALSVILIIIISISNELRKIDVIKLIK